MRQHTFKPEICAESTKIHQESNKGDFLQRVARDAARKEHEAVRQKVYQEVEPTAVTWFRHTVSLDPSVDLHRPIDTDRSVS